MASRLGHRPDGSHCQQGGCAYPTFSVTNAEGGSENLKWHGTGIEARTANGGNIARRVGEGFLINVHGCTLRENLSLEIPVDGLFVTVLARFGRLVRAGPPGAGLSGRRMEKVSIKLVRRPWWPQDLRAEGFLSQEAQRRRAWRGGGGPLQQRRS